MVITHAELQKCVSSALADWINQSPNERTDPKGMVSYTSLESLGQTSFYIMGFNPAVDKANEHLQALKCRDAGWSSYTHQCWTCGRDVGARQWCCGGSKRHQATVIKLIEALGHQPHEIYATNAMFVESKEVSNLAGKSMLWKNCWEKVHQVLIEQARPKWIICLGNGTGWSSFDLLRKQFNGVTKYCSSEAQDYRDGKYFSAPGFRVLGIPHPSRFGLSDAILKAPYPLDACTANY